MSHSPPGDAGKQMAIDAQYVRDRLTPILNNEDLSRYIL
jgi:ATP-dependent protease HslVU (ClpYQ) ATPase subunit